MTMTDDNNKIMTKHTKTTIMAMTMTDDNNKIMTKHTKQQ